MKKILILICILSVTWQVDAQRASYNFTQYFKMKTIITGNRSRDNSTMTQRLDYNRTNNNLSISKMNIETSGRRRGNENKNIDRIIMDMQTNNIYTFMNMGDRKVKMRMPLRLKDMTNPTYSSGDDRYRLTAFSATGVSKKIGDEMTNEYKGTASGVVVFVYISKKAYPTESLADLHRIIYRDYSQKRRSNRIPIMAAFENEIVRDKLLAGHMVLAYKWVDTRNNKTVETQILKFGNQSTTFNASVYQSLF